MADSRARTQRRRQTGGDADAVGAVPVKVLLDEASLPALTYTNNLVTHFTGTEVVLFGTFVQMPFPSSSSPPLPRELAAKVEGRWVMPTERYVDHIIRSLEMIRSNAVLNEMYEEMQRRRGAGGQGA